ncbi:MAG: hypothetical protein MJB14_01570 [Spirochaetes bacterium]|nr:hypothetical protein [Spirochaetota bacterium]
MNKKQIILILLLLLSFQLFSQNKKANILENLGLTEDQIEQVESIEHEMNRKIEEAKIELKIQKALLERELFNEKVDMKKVEKILKETLTYQMQIELADITKRVKIREIMGTENWKKLMEYFNRQKQKKENRKPKQKN